ncbi:MAG: hypothetical protein OEN01_07800 [Candidatus Krumholzibacteria bacterium]|nr:hypothetical protein [Candidatus Krumholzibacteria bacterium]
MPPPPTFHAAEPIPIIVGVQLVPSSADRYGPRVVALLREMDVFQYLIWPYDASTPVDAVLTLFIEGAWEDGKGSRVTSVILVALTAGLLGPVLGTNMSGVHDVTARLLDLEGEVSQYSFRIESKAARGLGANADVSFIRADDLQMRRLAVELAKRMHADRENIMKALVGSDKDSQGP